MSKFIRRNNSIIQNFGQQWNLYPDNNGFYGSIDALKNIVSPLLNFEDIQEKEILDVGSGTGRYTLMLHQAGACQIVAIEPSSAFNVLKNNTKHLGNVYCYQSDAEDIYQKHAFDMVFCIGVLQFITDPIPALKSMG
ncbi:MAG TPA: class I SAM-dependent methyltransferase, partial [Desulfohalobiaceae bacterium]|nr:class I SAM-dependent methyltransferase [Desulfohalobiaceae bacterium]